MMEPLREHVVGLLQGGDAHLGLNEAVAGLAEDLRGQRPPGFPYSPWELLEHMRLAQWDILQFSCSEEHVTPPFPEGFWPEAPVPAEPAAWERSIEGWRADCQALQDLVADPSTDLLTPLPWGEGQTVLREALLAADHNAYHIGALVAVRRALGAW